MAIGVSAWIALNVNARTRLSARNENTAELARQHLQAWIDNRLELVKHMRDHTESLGHFNKNAESIMSGFPGFLAINWISPDYQIKSVLPAEPNASALGKFVTNHPDPRVREAIQDSTYSSALQGTLVDDLFQGGAGYVTYLRVLDKQANVQGYINSVFRLDQFEYIALLGTPIEGDSRITIHTNDSADLNTARDNIPFVAAPIELPGVEIILHVQPSPQALARSRTPMADIALTIYVLIAILIAMQFALWLRRGQRLTESLQFSGGLAESIPQAAHIYNCDTNQFEFFSGRLETLLGEENAKRIRRSSGFFDSLVHELDRSHLLLMTQNAIDQSDGQLLEAEFRLEHSDGTLRWFRTRNCVVTRDMDGAKTLVGTTEDITDRKQMLEELGERVEYERLFADLSARFINVSVDSMDDEMRKALDQLSAFFNVERCFISEFEEDTTIIKHTIRSCNPNVESVSDEMKGINVVVTPWIVREYAQNGYIAIDSVANLPYEASIVRTIFEEYGVQSVINVPITTHGKLCGWLGLECITYSKQWDQTLIAQLLTVGQILGNAIDRRNAGASIQYRIAFENIITRISTEFINIAPDDFDTAFGEALQQLGEFANVDRAYLMVFATSPEHPSHAFEWCRDGVDSYLAEAMKQPSEKLAWAIDLLRTGKHLEVSNRDDLPTEAQSIIEIMKHKKMHGMIAVPLTLRGHLSGYLGFDIRQKDYRWPEDTAQLLRIVGEVFISTIDRAKADAQRLKLEKQILHSQKLEGLGVLAGGIAHDFNNLLVGILGSADLALADLPDDNPAHKHIVQVLDASKRASDLTQQMLAYSGRGAFILRQLDLNQVVRETMPLVKASISKKTRIRLLLDENIPPINADATQMNQIAMNLFINASEALEDRPGDVTIRTGIETRQETASGENESTESVDYVFLEVADTGIGMDAETRDRIFDPFYSTKFTGRGLGLAAVTGIVKGHHGTISLKSAPNEGSVFRVLLPRAQVEVDTQPERKTTHAADEPWSVEGSILVVDDEPSVREFIRRALEHHGFDVITADGGRQATELFEQHWKEIYAVVLDMTMPDMGGFEVYQTLQHIDADVRVLLASGYSEQDATSQFEPKNLAGFIQKPFTTTELLDRLRESTPKLISDT